MSKNLRMQGWDFTSPGGYFVTICTKRMRPVFGTVVNGHMHLNDAGKVADAFWHPRFYEVRARDERAIANIRRYIRENPANDQVVRGAEPVYLGNQALLSGRKAAFLASRGRDTLPGPVSFAPGEIIISGFLSPMERQVFREGFREKRAMIWVVPHGLKARQIHSHTACRAAIDEGRLLLISPFSDRTQAPNARRASWCNQFAVSLAERIIIGHLNPVGMLACILSEADPDKEIIIL